jgi:iron complex outermembrane receptor protein
MKTAHRKQIPLLLIASILPLTAIAADSTDIGQIMVEGTASGNGMIITEDTPKARSTVSRQAIDEKSSLNNTFQLIDLLPGINSYSQDATGLFGGGLRMRGFASDQLGISIDGVPVNDAGNFAVYPQEFADPENIQEIFITQGSSDTDAPHVGASGGDIGLVTSSPTDLSRMRLQQTFGSNNAKKTFVRADTGLVFDGKLKTFISYSEAKADKWKGAGGADRKHLDFKSVLNLNKSDSITAGFLWNRTFTHNLRTLTLAQINTLGANADWGTVVPQGAIAPTNGYYNLNLNPFENYIASVKGSFQLTPALHLDIEPYFWYGYGTGGNELRAILGNLAYSGALTETHRPGITTRLSTQIDNQKLMAGYWFEHTNHRKTQPAVAFGTNGTSVDPWLQNPANYILNPNGTPYQGRNFQTVNTAQSLFLQDEISLMQDRLKLILGVRKTSIRRDFTNYASQGGGDQFNYNIQREYSKTLPSFAARYQMNNEQQLFFNVAENFRAPNDDVFYGLIIGGTAAAPILRSVNATAETSTNYDLGYRYTGQDLTASGSLFLINFNNRIANAYNPSAATSTSYNVGSSNTRGIELESAWRFLPKWSTYGSLTYTQSTMLQNLNTAAGVFETTAGHQFPDTPNWMAGASLQYRDGPWSHNLSAKYTGRRYSTLVNDESLSGFTLFSLDNSVHLPSSNLIKNPTLHLNIYNLFNASYLYLNAGSGAGLTTRALGAGGVAPTYYVGAPRAFSMMLSADL